MLGEVHPSVQRLRFGPVHSVAVIANVAKFSASVPEVVDDVGKGLEPLSKGGEGAG